MKYAEFLEKSSFSHEELLAIGYGTALDDPPEDFGKLPLPPMLMFDRVTALSKDSNQRTIIAEQDVRKDHWFFLCHFLKDPVQPGCLGVDAVWQLLGLYCAAAGAKGTGRALGCKEVAFFGQIRPLNKTVRYELAIRRYQYLSSTQTAIVIANAKVFVDDQHIYDVKEAKVGTFRNICYTNYPFCGPNSIGGLSG
jgi:3-hydroxyacyl-[acyl-carrier protein] dehydratase/trans-2-decenoyl-[acyl-carrier protein] isomerase